MPTIAFEGRHCSGQREPGRLVAKNLALTLLTELCLQK